VLIDTTYYPKVRRWRTIQKCWANEISWRNGDDRPLCHHRSDLVFKTTAIDHSAIPPAFASVHQWLASAGRPRRNSA
jgi:hypothetical protein